MRRFIVCAFVGALMASRAASAAEVPCTNATAACTQMVAIPGIEGRTLVYRSYPLDARNPAITRALIVIHGYLRDADAHYRAALAAAFLAGALGDTLIIAPRFASSDGGPCNDALAPGEIAWHCQLAMERSWHTGGPAISGEVTSFDVVDELLRKLDRKDLFPNLHAIVVAGNSGGGQFVTRYAMTNGVHDVIAVKPAYVAVNPSSYAYLDEMRPGIAALGGNVAALPPGYHEALPANPPPSFRPFPDARNCTGYDKWPYGLQSREGYAAKVSDAQMKKNLAQRPTTFLLGEMDIVPLYGFDNSCAAMAQGGTRLARGLAYARYANERFGARDSAVVVDGCGHNTRCMFTSDDALSLLFPR